MHLEVCFMEIHGVRKTTPSGSVTGETYKDLCETCEAEIKNTIKGLMK